MDEPRKSLVDRILDPLLSRWWGKILFGVVLLSLAYWLYGDFCRFEAGEKQRIVGSKLVVGTYKLLGKWPPVGFVAISGAALIGFDIDQLVRGEKEL